MNNGSLALSSDPGHLLDGIFDAARMLAMLAHAVNDALANGYAGLWATGDMTWELGTSASSWSTNTALSIETTGGSV